MGLIKQNKDVVARKSWVLKKTHTISQDDIEVNDNWNLLSKEYASYKDGMWDEKAQVSLINSIIYQQRAAFVLTRDNFRDLLNNDKNWSKPVGLKNDKWKKFLQASSGLFMLDRYVQGKTRKVAIYRVISADLLGMLSVNLTDQISEIENFIKNNTLPEGDGLGDESGDGGLDLDEEMDGGIDSSVPSNLEDSKEKGKLIKAPYQDRLSLWYQHYLKSPYNETIFTSLPEGIQLNLYNKTRQLEAGAPVIDKETGKKRVSDGTDAKDQLIVALEAYRQKLNPTVPVDIDSLVIDL